MDLAPEPVSKMVLKSSPTPLSARTLKALADEIYHALRRDGCQPRDIVALSSGLIELVTDHIKTTPPRL